MTTAIGQSNGAAALNRIRERIRDADRALVAALVAAADRTDDAWLRRAAVRRRIALGREVAVCKFQAAPHRFRALAKSADAAALEGAITDRRVEAVVLARIRRQVRARGGSPDLARRIAGFYRGRVIPRTKRIQIRWLTRWGRGERPA